MIAAIRVGQLGVWEQIRECPADDHQYRFTHDSDGGRYRHYVCRRCCLPRRLDLGADYDGEIPDGGWPSEQPGIDW